MLELWLVRHGVTDWNLEGRIQGWSDPPLTALRLEAQRTQIVTVNDHAHLRPGALAR
jgi:broad specificity phosphatase PhoE